MRVERKSLQDLVAGPCLTRAAVVVEDRYCGLLAQEWTYRWLAAARHEPDGDRAGAERLRDLAVRPRGRPAATNVAGSEPDG